MKKHVWNSLGAFFFILLVCLVCLLVFFIISNNTHNTSRKEGFDSGKPYLQGIDVVYWINLDRSPERRTWMEGIFSQPLFEGILNQRFPAIDGKMVDVFSFFESSQRENPQITKVEYACLASHLEAIRIFAESGKEVAMMMEDDMSMEFQPYWNKTVTEIMREAPPNWEVIQLCYIGEIPQGMYDSYRYSTGAYLINKKGAKRLMQLKQNGVYHLSQHPTAPYLHADMFIFSYLNTYCYKYPMFIYKDDNDSLIHEDHLRMHVDSKREIEKMYQSM